MNEYSHYIDSISIVNAIRSTQYYNVASFSYDYDQKIVLYKNKPFQVKLESIRFKDHLKGKVLFNWKLFMDAVYFLAVENTPEEDRDENDVLMTPIQNWLSLNHKNKVTIFEIIREALNGRIIDASKKSLEIKVAKCLKSLGWKKHRVNHQIYWIK